VELRPLAVPDLPVLFEFQRDPESTRMAAFTPKDPDDWTTFQADWTRRLRDANLVTRAVLRGGRFVGYVVLFEMFGQPTIAYWIDRTLWGQGIATRALTAFLAEVSHRPLYARVAHDNVGSLRVLEKCGFVVVGRDRGFANARGAEIEEYILRREAP
jgi:RimJ/RimL family protein N-acetyltransferase